MRKIRSSDSGSAAVEFALVLPILVGLVAAITSFGFLFNQWQQLEHATREGARWASLQNSTAQVKSTVIAAAPSLKLPAANISVSPDPPVGLPLGTEVKVDSWLDVPMFFPKILGTKATVRLKASATQRSE